MITCQALAGRERSGYPRVPDLTCHGCDAWDAAARGNASDHARVRVKASTSRECKEATASTLCWPPVPGYHSSSECLDGRAPKLSGFQRAAAFGLFRPGVSCGFAPRSNSVGRHSAFGVYLSEAWVCAWVRVCVTHVTLQPTA